MKKLTITQWITLIVTLVAAILDTGLFPDGSTAFQILTKLVIVAGLFKFARDQYNAYSEKNVIDFTNHNAIGTKNKSLNKQVAKIKLTKWRKSQ